MDFLRIVAKVIPKRNRPQSRVEARPETNLAVDGVEMPSSRLPSSPIKNSMLGRAVSDGLGALFNLARTGSASSPSKCIALPDPLAVAMELDEEMRLSAEPRADAQGGDGGGGLSATPDINTLIRPEPTAVASTFGSITSRGAGSQQVPIGEGSRSADVLVDEKSSFNSLYSPHCVPSRNAEFTLPVLPPTIKSKPPIFVRKISRSLTPAAIPSTAKVLAPTPSTLITLDTVDSMLSSSPTTQLDSSSLFQFKRGSSSFSEVPESSSPSHASPGQEEGKAQPRKRRAGAIRKPRARKGYAYTNSAVPADEEDDQVRPYGCAYPACMAQNAAEAGCDSATPVASTSALRLQTPMEEDENFIMVDDDMGAEKGQPEDGDVAVPEVKEVLAQLLRREGYRPPISRGKAPISEDLNQTSFRTLRGLRAHVSRHVQAGDELPNGKAYRCTLDPCDKFFKNESGIQYHFQSASRSHFRVTKRGAKRTFIPEIVPTIRTFACIFDGCDKRYKLAAGLGYHLTHTPEHAVHEGTVKLVSPAVAYRMLWHCRQENRMLDPDPLVGHHTLAQVGEDGTIVWHKEPNGSQTKKRQRESCDEDGEDDI